MTVTEINFDQQSGVRTNQLYGLRTFTGDNATCKVLKNNLYDTPYDATINADGSVNPDGSTSGIAVGNNILVKYDTLAKGRGMVIAQYIEPSAVSIRKENYARVYIKTVSDYEKIIYDTNGKLVEGIGEEVGEVWKANFDNRRLLGEKALIIVSTAADAATFNYNTEILAKQGRINNANVTIGTNVTLPTGTALFLGLRDSSFQAQQPELVYLDHVFMYNINGWNTGAKRQKFQWVVASLPVLDVDNTVVPGQTRTAKMLVPVTEASTHKAPVPSNTPFEEDVVPYESATFDFSGYTAW